MEKRKLNNGTEIPCIGLGVFRLENTPETQEIMETAFRVGYRHIDTAAAYKNEESVGKAVRNSGIPREEIFITTKVANNDQRNDRVMESFESSLERLGMDYVDLYLVHWPVADKFRNTWKIFEKIYESGRAKAVGVSNFKLSHLKAVKEISGLVPAVNQIELHPYLIQQEELDYCRKEGIQVEAWSPFTAGKTALLEEKILKDLAEKYSKTPVQIVLRWNFQRDVVVIPKTSHKERLIENIHIFDFELTESEIGRINSLNRDQRTGPDPDNIYF